MKMKSLSDHLNDEGYFIIRGLLEKNEVDFYRDTLCRLAGEQGRFHPQHAAYKRWTLANGVAMQSEFWSIIWNERLVAFLRNAFSLEEKMCFTQHSDLHVNNGIVGWHRDSANRRFGSGLDWDESRAKYRVVRVAIYLQSFAESGFKLGVLPGSHRLPCRLFEFQCRAFAYVRRLVTDKRNILPPIILGKKPAWIAFDPGDCIVFDARLLHSGGPVHGPKYAIYLSYGVNNEHSYRHRDYYFKERPELGYREMRRELVDRLWEEGLLLKGD